MNKHVSNAPGMTRSLSLMLAERGLPAPGDAAPSP